MGEGVPVPVPASAIDAHARASAQLEVACDFTAAAREALLADDPRRAAHLAALGGDEPLAAAAIARIAETLPHDEALRAARELVARGFGRQAGALFSRLDAHREAGAAFALSGDACNAAHSLELGGRPADAARALEAALRMRPGDGACRLELGRLLARHGRTEAAAKALQQLDATSDERTRSLPLLRRCLTELGLEEAARELALEMEHLGVADDAPSTGGSAASGPPGAPTALSGGAHGPLVLGRYETVREVAVTPHARVLEAFDRLVGDRVAVKLLAGIHEDTGRDVLFRFEREARALAQLRHPHIVPFRAYHPEGPAIVLAWMAGGSLADRIPGRGEAIAPARAVEITCAVLSALGEAHRLGILHRDVKPSNVLFDDAGAARLSDFGAAHLGDVASTATAGAIGTFAYMSPEQRAGRPATLQSDLYGAGVLLAELLTGEAPAPVVDRLERAPSHRHPDITEVHDAIVARFLQSDPVKRPADAFEARRLLLSIAWPSRVWTQPEHTAARPPSARPSPGPDGRLTTPTARGDGRDDARRHHDGWLDRDVLVVSLDDDAMLARARAFALAGHPALPDVLRVDVIENAVWIAPPRGCALADEQRALAPEHVARVREALEALHAVEGAHGCVDPEHLYWHDGDVTLAFPRVHRSIAEGTVLDRLALARLAAA